MINLAWNTMMGLDDPFYDSDPFYEHEGYTPEPWDCGVALHIENVEYTLADMQAGSQFPKYKGQRTPCLGGFCDFLIDDDKDWLSENGECILSHMWQREKHDACGIYK